MLRKKRPDENKSKPKAKAKSKVKGGNHAKTPAGPTSVFGNLQAKEEEEEEGGDENDNEDDPDWPPVDSAEFPAD